MLSALKQKVLGNSDTCTIYSFLNNKKRLNSQLSENKTPFTWMCFLVTFVMRQYKVWAKAPSPVSLQCAVRHKLKSYITQRQGKNVSLVSKVISDFQFLEVGRKNLTTCVEKANPQGLSSDYVNPSTLSTFPESPHTSALITPQGFAYTKPFLGGSIS